MLIAYGQTITTKLDLINGLKIRADINPSEGYSEQYWNTLSPDQRIEIAMAIAAKTLTKNRISLE